MRPLTDDDIRQIGELYHDGWGERQIGRMVDRSEHTVRAVLRGVCERYRVILGGRLQQGPRPKKQLAIYRR